MSIKLGIQRCLALMGMFLALGTTAQAVEIAGVKVDDTAKVANVELKLNGAGIRYKAIFKVYVAALYMTDRKTTPAEVFDQSGPKRVALTLRREVSSDSFSQAFMDGLNHNSTAEDKMKLFDQMLQIGKIFGSYRTLKEDDTILLDWVPGTGTVVTVNGKKAGSPIPEADFYKALLKIWLGDQPADRSLKRQLLGG